MTKAAQLGTLGYMVWTEKRLTPERRRRRLQLLAELAEGKLARERQRARRAQGHRLRELISMRRRLAG